MAEFFRFGVSISVLDGVNRTAVTTYYITKADLNAYIDAVDDAARAATDVGVLVAAHLAMQDGSFEKLQVFMETINDPVPDPPDDSLRGNKILIHGRAAGRGVSWTIPCRDPDSYVQLPQSLELSQTEPTEATDYITAVNANVKDMFGNAVTFHTWELVD